MMINCRHKNFPSLLLTGIKENYCLMCLDSKSFGGGRHPEHLASLSPGGRVPAANLNTQEAEFSQIPGNQNHALGHLASVLQPDCLLELELPRLWTQEGYAHSPHYLFPLSWS